MKKKLTVAIALILLLAVSITMLVGCDEMFTRNEERDATQVVATVDYHGLSANIYKFELVASYNNYSYIYVSYYGMSEKEAANYILRSLAQQKLLTLYAREKVTELMKLDAIPADVRTLLTRSEVNKAIDDTNESLLNQLKTVVEKNINDDNYNNAGDDKKSDDGDEDDKTEITDAVTVRFDSKGGSDVDKQRIQKGTKAKKPTNPTRDGYVFYGWYTDAECNEEDFVTGEWVAKTYTDDEGNKQVKKDKDGNVIYRYVSGEYVDETYVDDNGNLQVKIDDETGKPVTVYVGKEFNFGAGVEDDVTLYAKWVETTAARTEMPEVEEEEEDDYDPDDDSDTIEQSPSFFSEEYRATIAEKLEEENFSDKISKNTKKTLDSYITDGIAELVKIIKSNTFKKTEEECYNYYLANQLDTVLVAKLQRLIGNSVTVSEEEVKAEFDAVVNKNKQTFTGSNGESAYESALTSTLDSTYYHPTLKDATDSYGFVINILLKLDADSIETLTEMCKEDPTDVGAEKAKIIRNRLISEMKIKVSNPNYKSSEVVKDEDGEEIELLDPMTDPKNPYNSVGGRDKNTEFEAEGGNDYENLVKFGYNEEAGKFEITYGATEHAAMPYLEQQVYAFSKDGKVGIIEQIHNSLNDVMSYVDKEGDVPKLSKEQGVYWLREVATKWLYLVGDDSGAVSDSSNNGGLGYLVTPEGKDSGFLSDFTDYARALVRQGTGAYFVEGSDMTDAFSGDVAADGAIAGNGVAYVIADSFIGNGTTSFDNAYAGVFVLLDSYTVWTPDKYEYPDGESSEERTLPIGYNMTVGKDEDDIKSIYDAIYDKILEAKKSTAYNLDVNTMGAEYMEKAITYYEKAYQSLWK